MYDIKRHFKATRKDRKVEKLRSDFIFNTIVNNKEVIKWNGESGNRSKYSILKKEKPNIVEFSEDEYEHFISDYQDRKYDEMKDERC